MGLLDETLDYWSAEGSIMRTLNGLEFGLKNPSLMYDGIKEGAAARVDYVADKADKAFFYVDGLKEEAGGYVVEKVEKVVDYSTGILVKTALIVGGLFIGYVFLSSYVKTKAAAAAK